MPFTPFVFVNKNAGGGANQLFGTYLSAIFGPDGGSDNGGLVLNSVLTGSVNAPASGQANASYQFLNNSSSAWQGAASNPLPNDLFGAGGSGQLDMGGIALDQGTAAIQGYPFQPSTISANDNQGRAYIWNRSLTGVWTQTQRIDGSAPGAQCGTATALSGAYAAIGEIGVSAGAGQVRIFNLSGGVWTQTQILAPGDLSAGDDFGAVMFMIGIYLFVAAGRQGTDAGAVYVFKLSAGTWSQVSKFTGAAPNDFFGSAISCDGTTLVIGAPFNSTTGQAYVYTLVGGTWTLQTTLVGSDSVAGDDFAIGVGVSGGVIVIGATNLGAAGAQSAGKAYVFTGAAAVWTQQQEIVPSDSTIGGNFGRQVAAYTGLGLSWLAITASGSAAVNGSIYFYSSASIDPPVTPASQLVFYGVRRIKGGAGASDPAPSNYKYYEKPFQIPFSFNIAVANQPTIPLLQQGQPRLFVRIDDYDFELRHITKYCTDSHGVQLTSPSPFAIILYDSVQIARSNIPIIAEALIDDVLTPNGRNFWPSPPIMYKIDSNISFDVFTLVDSTVSLPVTVNLLFDGIRRINCV